MKKTAEGGRGNVCLFSPSIPFVDFGGAMRAASKPVLYLLLRETDGAFHANVRDDVSVCVAVDGLRVNLQPSLKVLCGKQPLPGHPIVLWGNRKSGVCRIQAAEDQAGPRG